MDFETVVKSRFAVRKFDGKVLPEDKVEKLLEIVRHAPSSYNIQPWMIRVVKNQELKDKLMAAAWNQPQIGSASHVLVFCANTDIVGCIDKLEHAMKQSGKDVSAYVGMMRQFEQGMNHEQKKYWAQRQVYLALSNAVNGAKSLGFDSCPMEGFNPQAFSEILELPAHIVPTVICTIGHAIDSLPAKYRFPLHDIVIKDQ